MKQNGVTIDINPRTTMYKLNYYSVARLAWAGIIIVLLYLVIACAEVFAEVPRTASQSTIIGNRLMVSVRQEDGVLSVLS